MAVIDYTDVATAIGRPISTTAEQDQVTEWIANVEMLIQAKLGALDDLDQTLLAYVIREVVIARMRYRQDRNSSRNNVTEDDTDTGYEHYFLRVLAPWWSLLTSDGASDAPTGAFSVRPYFESDEASLESWA